MNKTIKKIFFMVTTTSYLIAGMSLNLHAAVVNTNKGKINSQITEEAEQGEEALPEESNTDTESNVSGLVDISEISNEHSNQVRIGTGFKINEPLDNAVPVLHYYEIEGDGVISPGESFTLKFVIYNPGVTSKLGNVRLFITQKDNLVYPVYGKTNSLYLGYMNALSYVDGEITLKASKKISTSEVPIMLSLHYTDNYNTNAEFNTDALLPVSASGRLFVDSIDMPSAMYVGNNNRLRIVYRNNGLSTINNVTLHIQGDSIENQEVSFGSIGNNTSMTNDAYVALRQQGVQNIKLYFTYTDSDGVGHETDPNEYELDVKPYSESSDKNSEFLQKRYKMNNQMTYGVLGVSVLVLINLLIQISIKRKKDNL